MLLLIILFPLTGWAQLDTTYFYQADKELDLYKQIECYSKAIHYCAPNSGELRMSYIYRAISKYAVEDYYGAISDIETAIPIQVTSSKVYWINHLDHFSNSENKMAYMILGHCYIKLRQKEKACLSYSKAGEYGEEKAYEYIQQYCK